MQQAGNMCCLSTASCELRAASCKLNSLAYLALLLAGQNLSKLNIQLARLYQLSIQPIVADSRLEAGGWKLNRIGEEAKGWQGLLARRSADRLVNSILLIHHFKFHLLLLLLWLLL